MSVERPHALVDEWVATRAEFACSAEDVSCPSSDDSSESDSGCDQSVPPDPAHWAPGDAAHLRQPREPVDESDLRLVIASRGSPGGRAEAPAPRPSVADGDLTPRMSAVYERTCVRPHDDVRSVIDAVVMPAGMLGKRTEVVRQIALREAVEGDRALSNAVARVLPRADAVLARAAPEPSPATRELQIVPHTSVPPKPVCTPSSSACVAFSRPSSAAPVGGSTSSASCFTPNFAGEQRHIDKAVSDLLRCIPDEMLLFDRPSAVPAHVRRLNLESSLKLFDAGTIEKGSAAVKAWVEFCERNRIPRFGAPYDADMCVWFLREEDERARSRAAAAKSTRTGASVMHGRACALRWLASVRCVPFDAADASVRKFAVQDRSSEPAATPMWEVALMRHLLIVAVRFCGPRDTLVRAYAAAAYVMCLASLRQLDALRSDVPRLIQVGGVPSFHAVAILSKAPSRSRMRPMPWWVPACSVEPSISDSDAAAGLDLAFSAIPSGSPSMFMQLLDSDGRPATLATAVSFGRQRVESGQLAGSLTYLFTWAPLSYTPSRAREVAKLKHGPRHTLPEIARVLGMPSEARDELGRWKHGGGRLHRLANRYSRDGERLMQVIVRQRVATCILRVIERVQAHSPGPFARVPLEAFVAPAEDVRHEEALFRDASRRCLATAHEGD